MVTAMIDGVCVESNMWCMCGCPRKQLAYPKSPMLSNRGQYVGGRSVHSDTTAARSFDSRRAQSLNTPAPGSYYPPGPAPSSQAVPSDFSPPPSMASPRTPGQCDVRPFLLLYISSYDASASELKRLTWAMHKLFSEIWFGMSSTYMCTGLWYSPVPGTMNLCSALPWPL
jgi:hypothetical protein